MTCHSQGDALSINLFNLHPSLHFARRQHRVTSPIFTLHLRSDIVQTVFHGQDQTVFCTIRMSIFLYTVFHLSFLLGTVTKQRRRLRFWTFSVGWVGLNFCALNLCLPPPMPLLAPCPSLKNEGVIQETANFCCRGRSYSPNYAIIFSRSLAREQFGIA